MTTPRVPAPVVKTCPACNAELNPVVLDAKGKRLEVGSSVKGAETVLPVEGVVESFDWRPNFGWEVVVARVGDRTVRAFLCIGAEEVNTFRCPSLTRKARG